MKMVYSVPASTSICYRTYKITRKLCVFQRSELKNSEIFGWLNARPFPA